MAERLSDRKDKDAGSGTENEQQSPYLNTYVHLAHNLKLHFQLISRTTKHSVRKVCVLKLSDTSMIFTS